MAHENGFSGFRSIPYDTLQAKYSVKQSADKLESFLFVRLIDRLLTNPPLDYIEKCQKDFVAQNLENIAIESASIMIKLSSFYKFHRWLPYILPFGDSGLKYVHAVRKFQYQAVREAFRDQGLELEATSTFLVRDESSSTQRNTILTKTIKHDITSQSHTLRALCELIDGEAETNDEYNSRDNPSGYFEPKNQIGLEFKDHHPSGLSFPEYLKLQRSLKSRLMLTDRFGIQIAFVERRAKKKSIFNNALEVYGQSEQHRYQKFKEKNTVKSKIKVGNSPNKKSTVSKK